MYTLYLEFYDGKSQTTYFNDKEAAIRYADASQGVIAAQVYYHDFCVWSNFND